MDAHWLPDSFFRSPRWRWLRAAPGVRPDARLDDDWVDAARRLQAGGAIEGPEGRAAAAALDLWRAEDPTPRTLLQARLLAGVPIAEVGRACGLPVAVVTAYHDLFFEVRP